MKSMFLAALGGIVALTATPVSAAVLVCAKDEACYGMVDLNDPGNVLINQGSSPVTGSLNNISFLFSSTTDTLTAPSNGQARVQSSDGILNGLTFTIESGYTFGSALFNLNPLTGNPNLPTKSNLVNISYFTPGVGMQSQAIDTNGQNFLRVFGTAGERFTSIGFLSASLDRGISDLRQLRIDDVQPVIVAVPEPSTWAMMIFGLGAVGGAMRRRKVRTAVSYA